VRENDAKRRRKQTEIKIFLFPGRKEAFFFFFWGRMCFFFDLDKAKPIRGKRKKKKFSKTATKQCGG